MTIHCLNESNIDTNCNKSYFGINTHEHQIAYSNINNIKQLELETREIEFYHLDLIGKIDKLDHPIEKDNSFYLYSMLNNNIGHLLYLELSGNRLTPNYIKPLSRFIIDTSTLLHLDISTSIIEDDSLELLFDAITKNNSLIKLDISGISINIITARYLSILLETQTTIRYYNLYNTFHSMASFSICFDKIDTISSSIDTLLLGNNKIDDNHLSILLNSITNNTLQFLDLILNNITYKSLDNIRKWLTPVTLTFDNLFDRSYQTSINKLSKLDITGNYLDNLSSSYIVEIIKNNINLNLFSVDYNISLKNNIMPKIERNNKCVINIERSTTHNNSIIISLYKLLPIDIIEQLLRSTQYLEILYLKSL